LANTATLDVVSIDKSINISNNYPITALKKISTTAREAAQKFIEFVMGDGQKILKNNGFAKP